MLRKFRLLEMSGHQDPLVAFHFNDLGVKLAGVKKRRPITFQAVNQPGLLWQQHWRCGSHRRASFPEK
jgi:hypothetical protein